MNKCWTKPKSTLNYPARRILWRNLWTLYLLLRYGTLRQASPTLTIQSKASYPLAVPKFSRKLGRISNFNQSTNWHMKDHVEIGHLNKYDAFRANRDQVMDVEIWFKIHTNVSNFETVSPKPYISTVTIFISFVTTVYIIPSCMHLLLERSWDENRYVCPFLRVSRKS